jgi:hypothetical protein
MTMNKRTWTRLWKILVLAAVLLVGALYLLTRIDRSEPLTSEQRLLKPGAQEITAAREADSAACAEYFTRHALSPEDYVVEKFRTHDVVLLGEAHQIREDCELICRLIEPVYRRAGVKILAMEIVKTKRNDEINRLLQAPEFDAARLVDIFREDYFYWGFAEYQDILRAVWQFNKTLAPGEAPFRVIGLQPDMNIFAIDCGSLPSKVMQFPRLLRMEQLYAQPLITGVLDKGEKALVQVGYYHTFPHYRQPKVIRGKMYGEFARVRMGRLLAEKYGARIFQIVLHARHDGAEHYSDPPGTPVMNLLEKLYRDHGGTPVGFDVENSPLALLRDSNSWFFAYQKHVTFDDLAQGYILQMPFEKMHAVRWIDGFVTPANFRRLRTYALQRKLISESEGNSPAELNRKLSDQLVAGVRFL